MLKTKGGTLAYDDLGSGVPVVMLPGMGDLRSSYRFTVPALSAAGYRAISVDVRGMGDTSAVWDDYSVGAVGRDALRVVEALDAGPAHIVGNSMGAGAAVVAAAERPELVRSITLVGPFVRDVMPPWAAKVLFGALLGGPWRAALWDWYGRLAFPQRQPPDFAAEAGRRRTNLREPGRFAAFRRMAVASKRESERRLADVAKPVLVVMGSKDPDFPDPAREAQRVAAALQGESILIDGAGHYPQADSPDAFSRALLGFLASVDATGGRRPARLVS
jgi:pimeloyl-ACP methyl ester carboxylesterase